MRIQLGEALRACGGFTFSGWTCILRQGLEPALTQKSWLRALCFTALPAYYRSRPRTLAIKTRPGGPYLAAGEATMAWTDVRPFSGRGKGLKVCKKYEYNDRLVWAPPAPRFPQL